MVRSINPRTGTVISDYAPTSSYQLRDAEGRARSAQRQWFSGTTLEQRVSAVKELEAVCRRRMDEVVGLMHEEVGIPANALRAAYNSVLAGVDHYVSEASQLQDMEYPCPATWTATTARLSLHPHGVLGHIGVWNFPFWQTMITAIPALLTGNAVVYKPSELCTGTGLRIAELVHEAGYPRDLYVPVIGGPEVGRMLVTSDVDALAFTGGMSTGLDITRNAGIKPLILELSGNDAAIVCGDADVEIAARGIAYGTFSRGGQICIRIKRVYAHEDIAEELVDRLVDIATRLNVEKDIGPLIREESRDKVMRTVDEAIRGGAELLCGGQALPGPGFFYQPTVLRHSDDRLSVVHNETFGPVCPVRAVRTDLEAVALANNSPYGLGATVWTRDYQKGEFIARQLEVGNVWVNECVRTLPGGEYFQGWKQSSIPSSMSRLQMFTKKQMLVTNRSPEPRVHWFS